ncbi:MAG: fibronectin type III domain-containing protein [Acidobacteria bacterium]|nr:fibronectin type III domain-containing protein [Acidobacteriota bacterium]
MMNRRACVLLAPAILLAGCANPAPPRPPSLNLPRASTDLSALRQGAHVQLTWTVATYTTDNLLLPGARAASSYRRPHLAHPGALAAEICRQDMVSHPVCLPIARVTVHAGEQAVWDDSLPLSLQTGTPHLIAYKVRVLNAAGRDAGFSAPAFVASGEAPAPMQGLHIRAVRQGAELKWTPSARTVADEEVCITREQVNAAKQSASSENKKPVEMRIAASPDPGGAVDRGATTGSEFRYTAVRMRAVSIGNQRLRILGEPATALSGVLMDTFPPPKPTGLVAISTPPNEHHKAAIDLSWDPVSDEHLAGYFVYRADGNLAPQRIVAETITGTSYHDEAVVLGHTYTYTVTAVDRTGNESQHSAPAEETIE